jgi:hypothetical protein
MRERKRERVREKRERNRSIKKLSNELTTEQRKLRPKKFYNIGGRISFLVPPEIVPGRMTLLVTVFLVLVNIFNSITRCQVYICL